MTSKPKEIKRRILIAEDDVDIIFTIRLNRASGLFDVDTCSDPGKALFNFKQVV